MKIKEEHSEGLRKFIDLAIENDEELQQLCNEKNVTLLAFIDSYTPKKYSPVSSHGATININDEFGMEGALNDIKSKTEQMETKKAYLLINSFGGSVSSSFKIAQAVRDAFDDITVFVPHIASSGATLLALTGNKIKMGLMSQLGPVDPQRLYRDHGFVSAKSMLIAKKRLDKKFEKRQEQEIGYPDRHMAEMIDPVIYEEFFGALEVSEKYLEIILEKAGYDGKIISKISRNLIYDLPTHDFVIDKNLAKEIGLKISFDDDLNEWHVMRNWFSKYVGKETDKHFIRYCTPKQNNY